MFSRYRLAGKITEKDMNRDYISRCIRPKKLLFTLNSVFNEYSLGVRWEDTDKTSALLAALGM